MKRYRAILGIGGAAAVIATVALLAARFAGRVGSRHEQSEEQPRQWPFDRDELRSLMARVVEEQGERVNLMEPGDSRARAEAFLAYYARRASAAT